MTFLTEKYINPFTDFGFKKLFGEELNKDLLLDFLNEVLREKEGEIVDLTYLKNEHLGKTAIDRKAIFDIYCENERGEKFVVEMQKSKQNYFKDRSVYYASFPIQEQAKRSEWNYKLSPVYTIGILDFIFDEDKDDPSKYRYDIQLKDIETNKVFYDKLTFIYFEMPKFNKSIDELETKFDKWLYVLKNLSKLHRLPEKLQESVFQKVFEVAKIATFTKKEIRSYEDSLKSYRDLKNSLDTAFDEGKIEGKIEGKEEGLEIGKLLTAVLSIKNGLEDQLISSISGLEIDKVTLIRKQLELKYASFSLEELTALIEQDRFW